jgi:hypothetical protein
LPAAATLTALAKANTVEMEYFMVARESGSGSIGVDTSWLV